MTGLREAFFLAWAHLSWRRGRTAVLVLAVALVLATPAAIQGLLTAAEARLSARAAATPLLVGARGSRLDLAMSALYFSDDQPTPIGMAAAERIWESDLADAIPLRTGFKASDAPIVGTTLDYLPFRGLELSAGRPFALLGEAVIGAGVAERLGLGVGDRITSAPTTLFDLAGVYPLRMPIVGVLAPSGGPDDQAIFVDVKTTWVIQGVGHGHDDVVGAPGAAAAGVAQFREITPQNVESFHFHGDPGAYPLTAVIAVPRDARSATILKGRYLDREGPEQIIAPDAVIAGLLAQVFRIKRALDAAVALVGLATAAAVGLALYLALQLRRREIDTAFRLGARRGLIAQMVAAEAIVVLGLAGIAASAIYAVASLNAEAAAAWLLSAA